MISLPQPGLRVRIAATIACIVVAAVAILVLTVHLLVVQSRIDQQRHAADANVVAAMSIYRSTGLLSFDAQLDDPRLPSDLTDALVADGAHGTDISGRGTRDLWAAGRVGDRMISIHTSFPTVDASVAAVDRALLLAGIGTAIAATIGGALSAGGLSRRLRLAARTVRELGTVRERGAARGLDTAGLETSGLNTSGLNTSGSKTAGPELTSAVPARGDGRAGAASGTNRRTLRAAVGSGSDEVGDLADAVDAMAARLDARLQAERRFTADVAHDLRTPLTGLVTAAALLDDSRPAQLVRNRVTAMADLVEELLEVARLDSGVETAQLAYARIPDIVQKAVQRGVAKGEFEPGSVTVSGDERAVEVLTDPRRLERVLSNLIRNGLEHGQPPVRVAVSGSRIVVTDSGSGFSPEFLAAGPQRFRRPGARSSSSTGTGGHGLGLIIAQGQTAILGGRLHFSNADPSGSANRSANADGSQETIDRGGAQVTIDLPKAPPGRTGTGTE